jgi:hypothetical protein
MYVCMHVHVCIYEHRHVHVTKKDIYTLPTQTQTQTHTLGINIADDEQAHVGRVVVLVVELPQVLVGESNDSSLGAYGEPLGQIRFIENLHHHIIACS